MSDGRGTVRITSYPGTLLSLYRAGLLTGAALADAQALAARP